MNFLKVHDLLSFDICLWNIHYNQSMKHHPKIFHLSVGHSSFLLFCATPNLQGNHSSDFYHYRLGNKISFLEVCKIDIT